MLFLSVLAVAARAAQLAASGDGKSGSHAKRVVLFGDQRIESHAEAKAAGRAAAFPFTDRKAGTASYITVYVGSRTSARLLLVGLYSNAAGHPGSRLASASLSRVKAGAWNGVPIRGVHVVAGNTYWIALLAKSRRIYFRVRGDRSRAHGSTSCRGISSREADLSSLPAHWTSGHRQLDCPISAYVSGAGGAGGSPGSQPAPPAGLPAPPPVTDYVAQNAAGSGNASSCLNAESVATLNANANKDWSPGNVIGLCGTITSAITAAGSGTAGHPIWVYWEPGASISVPYCPPNGCVNIESFSHITLDGGMHGTIQAAANGTNRTYQNESTGVTAENCTGCTVEGLTIADMYVHVAGSDYASNCSGGCHAIVFDGSNITIAYNTVHDCAWCLQENSVPGESNIRVYGNNVYNMDHGWALSNSGNLGALGPIYFFDNHLHDYANWDTDSNVWHHDGIHCFTTGNGGLPSDFSGGLYIYDNRFDGAVGSHMTSQIFMEGNTAPVTGTPCANSASHVDIFNNIITSTDQAPANSYFGAAAISGGGDYNNTVIGQGGGPCGGYSYQAPGDTIAFEDNVLTGCDTLVSQSGTAYSTGALQGVFAEGSPDYNVYANSGGNAFQCKNTYYAFLDFAGWRSCLAGTGTAPGGDAHSKAVRSAGLNPDGSPEPGSAVLRSGANLTSICNGLPAAVGTALCTSYTGPPLGGGAGSTTAGVARPRTGAWDAGAY